MLHDLTWDNYLELTKYIDDNNFKEEYFSPISLVSLIHYNVRHKYHILPTKEILLYVSYNTSTSEVLNNWSASTCIYFANSDIGELKKQIRIDLKQLNPDKDTIDFSDISEDMLNNFNLGKFNVIMHDYVSNYIYDMEKMRTFAGRKLQKKRNHLNAFYGARHNLTIKDLRDVKYDDIIAYLDYHMLKYDDTYRQYEMDIYKKYLHDEMAKDNKFFGTVVYIDDRIVAVTLCYERKNTCEIIMEKAERDIRGLYPFLIKTNLSTHDIKAPYMDRQDDGGIMELRQSKKSYYPTLIVLRYGIENIGEW